MGKIKLKSIKVFEQDEKIFTSNGLGIVHPTSCIIKRNLPEMVYSLELECIIDEQNKWKLFEVGRIIVTKNQPFRIGIVEHNPVDRTMKIYAEHLFFDLQNNFIEDTNVVDKNGNMAITQLLSHTVEPHNFIGTSDITEVNSFRCVRKQVLTALLGEQDASFINRWGGELDIDGLTFKINKQIGEDKGYKIKYGKNLTGLNYKTNMNLNTMVTKLRPVGFDGISLDEKYVISSHINDYPMPIIREIKYENVKWKGSPNFESREDDDSFIYDNLSDAQDKLRELAQKEFENGIDLLDVTLDVNFIELSKTEEYKDYKILETVELGDTVTLEYAPLGIYTKQRCVEYELDVLTDRYNSIVLGDCEPNFFNETNKVIGAVADAVISGKLNINGGISDNKIQEIISDMTEIMTNYLSGYVVITNNEILIMDTDDKETAQNVWRFNSAGIAHSSTGYNGTYTVGMTMDGHINGRIISANTIMGESMVANTVTARELAVELNKKIEDAQTKEQVEQIFNVGEGQLKSFISETYETKTEVTQKINDLSTDVDGKLNDKADKSTTYTKQEVNTQISQAQSNILLGVSETYETKTEVNQKISDLSDSFDGKLSDTIVKMDVMYYLSTSTENLNGGTWSTVAPKYEDGKYMWSKTITTFKNGTTKESTPTCIAGATGKDGKGISTITNYYLASNKSTGVTTSTSGWTTTIQNMSTTNKYLWNYEEVLYSDNSSITTVPIIIGVHGTNGSDGQNGVGIQSITEYYLITSASTGVTTSTSGWTTTVQTPTLSKKYLWNYEVISYTNNTNHTGTPRIIGNYAKDGENGTNGQDGANGKGIANITEYYATSTSNTIEPTSWVTTVPTMTTTNKYLWNYETITYTDKSSINTNKRVIGVYGDKGQNGTNGTNGADGKGITSITNYYLASGSSSGVTTSTTGWTTTVQTPTKDKKYLWNYEMIKYTDNSTVNTQPCIIGNFAQDGTNGKDGTSITSSDVEYYLSNSSTSLSGGSWSTTAPTWENGKYMWSRVKTTFSSGVTSQSQPVCITGQKGDNGTNGADGKGISSITEEYYLSNSKTTQSGGSWQTTAPTWSSGKYLWTRSKIVYTDQTIVYTTAICDNSWEAINEIEIGGRNLLIIKTKKSDHYIDWETGETLTSNNDYSISDYISCYNTKCVTLSYNGAKSGDYVFAFYDSNKTFISGCTANFNGKMSWTVEIPQNVSWLKVSCPDYDKTKLEIGNKATDYTIAPEDLLATIKDEQTALSTNIYNELNSINDQLMDYGNTNKITPQLKLSLKNMFNNVIATNDKLNSLYETIGILESQSFKDDKDTAYNNLYTQMDSLFSNITETTVKPISEIYDLFNDFYVKSTNLEKVLNHFAHEKLNYTYANLEMLKDRIDIAVGRVDTIEGHVEEINKHFTFNTDGLTIYSTDNNITSGVSLNLDNDQISFKEGNSTVAYISSNKLNIENAEVKKELIIGKFAWKPSPKGGVMLVKRDDL